jgi:L-arabinose transport system substrate-binding protein
VNLSLSRFKIRRLSLCALSALAGFNASCSKPADSKSGSPAPAATATTDAIKIGFLVKQPESPWFQYEWKFAEQAGRDLGFSVMKIGATDGEKVLSAIDNLAANGAQGFVICTPDTRLGPAIMSKAKAANLKVIAVDDQFITADGKPMQDVPYLGISASQIGADVGAVLADEMKKRDWSSSDTAVCAVTFDELATTKERTDNSIRVLIERGFPAARIFRAPQRTTDIPGAFDAMNTLLTKQPDVKHWLICGINDNAVLGAVRALEGRGYAPESSIGIGIDGTDCIGELEKSKPTSFYGAMLLQSRRHGYETAQMMYKWIKDGVKPPLDTRTVGVLITRENFQRVLKEQGLRD